MTILTIITPLAYSQTKFSIALTGAYAYIANSDYNDFVNGYSDLSKDLYEDPFIDMDTYKVSFEKLNSTLDGDIEFRIIPSSEFMIGVGVGYIALPVSTSVNKYDDTVWGSWEYEREYSISAVPLSLSGYYIINTGNNLNLNIGAGFEYYLGSLSIKNTKKVEDGISLNLDDTMEYSGSGIGISFKLGGEFKLSDNFALLGGVVGRFGKISGFEGDIKQNGSIKKEKLYSFDGKADNKTYHI